MTVESDKSISSDCNFSLKVLKNGSSKKHFWIRYCQIRVNGSRNDLFSLLYCHSKIKPQQLKFTPPCPLHREESALNGSHSCAQTCITKEAAVLTKTILVNIYQRLHPSKLRNLTATAVASNSFLTLVPPMFTVHPRELSCDSDYRSFNVFSYGLRAEYTRRNNKMKARVETAR